MAYNFPDSPTLNQVFQSYTWDGEKWISTLGGVSAMSAASAAFLARTSGLDATHTNAYVALIDGLVTDGIWSKLDVLHIYATQNTTTALLNLKSSSFNGTVHGSPTFTTDRSYSGVDSSSTIYVDTGFNPATATTPQFTQNSAHISMWSLTNGSNTLPAIAGSNTGAFTLLFPLYTDNNAYFRVNSPNSGGNVSNAATPTGHFIANRSSNLGIQGYRNGSSIFSSGAIASNAVANLNFYSVGYNNNGAPLGSAIQLAAMSFGSSLSGTDATNFYNRLRTYMTVVGVP